MNITFNKPTPSTGLITISLVESDYQLKVEAKLKDYLRKTVLPGFRPGKAPAGIIKKMYGPSVLTDEINSLLNEVLTEYMKEQEFRIFGEPLPNDEKHDAIDWETQKEFEFEFEVGLLNDFVVDLSPAVIIPYHVLKVDDHMIDREVSDLRKEHGTGESPEISEAGDILMGEVEGEGLDKKTVSLYLKTFSEEQVKPFIGLKINDKITLTLAQLPEHDKARAAITNAWDVEEEVAATRSFTFTVEEMRREIPAEMNEEFFENVFGDPDIKTEEEFRAEVRKMLEEENEENADFSLEDLIVTYLLKHTALEFPENFLRRWCKLQYKNVSDTIFDREFPQMLMATKWRLIEGKIARENDVRVELEEVMEYVRQMCRRKFRLPPDDSCQDKIETYVHDYLTDKNNGKKNYAEACEQIVYEKVMALIRDRITLERKELNEDEFLAIAEANIAPYRISE